MGRPGRVAVVLLVVLAGVLVWAWPRGADVVEGREGVETTPVAADQGPPSAAAPSREEVAREPGSDALPNAEEAGARSGPPEFAIEGVVSGPSDLVLSDLSVLAIQAVRDNPATTRGSVDEAGRFTIELASGGVHRIAVVAYRGPRVVVTDWGGIDAHGSPIVALSEQQPAASLRLQVTRAASLHGQYRLTDGRPAAGASVRLTPRQAGGGKTTLDVTTDATGFYEFETVVPGAYILAPSAPLEPGETMPSTPFFEFAPGDVVTHDLQARRAEGAISGAVVDESGAPVVDLAVVAYEKPPESGSSRRFARVRTDAAGRFELEGIPAAEVYVQVDADRQDGPHGMLLAAVVERRLVRVAAGERVDLGTVQVERTKPPAILRLRAGSDAPIVHAWVLPGTHDLASVQQTPPSDSLRLYLRREGEILVADTGQRVGEHTIVVRTLDMQTRASAYQVRSIWLERGETYELAW
jgi:protocatechuate 3,4-dioxygenase beta subunit